VTQTLKVLFLGIGGVVYGILQCLCSDSNHVVHNQQVEAECSPSGDRVGFLEDKDHSGSPSEKWVKRVVA